MINSEFNSRSTSTLITNKTYSLPMKRIQMES